MLKESQLKDNENVQMLAYWACVPSKNEAQMINIQMCIVLESEIISLILSQNYDSNISRQFLK